MSSIHFPQISGGDYVKLLRELRTVCEEAKVPLENEEEINGFSFPFAEQMAKSMPPMSHITTFSRTPPLFDLFVF